MSLLRKKPVKAAASAVPCRSKVLVALCALFTIAVPLAIIAAVILPHMGDGDANAATPDTATQAPAAPVSTTTLAPAAAAASPSSLVSSTGK